MSCSVAVCNSPVFSPSASIFCNKTSIISPAKETLTLNLTHLKPSASPSSPSSVASPTSPFRFRLQKPPTAFGSSSSSFANDLGSCSGQSPDLVLKRKRPPRLNIPVDVASFGAPATAMTPREEMREVERDDEWYSVYCKRGRREVMEDRFSALTNLQGNPKQAIFGVFDGHGGTKAAEFAAKHLGENILKEVQRDENGVEEGVREGYLTTDREFMKEAGLRGGSCCVTALIRDGNLVVSNAGDCRAVLSHGGVAEALTCDHRPSREDERDRIESTGGYVDMFHGVWRIQGSLAVSRGIGDRHLKQWVIPDPETKIRQLEPEHEFLILASDGLWDKVSNQEAVDIARPQCVGTDKASPLLVCKKLAELAASRGSCDDISVMLIQLPQFLV